MKTHVLVPRPRTLARPLGASLFGDLDAFFDEFLRLGSPEAPPATRGAVAPRMDWVDDEHEIRVRAEMPGLEEKEISVSLEDGVLTITGEHREESEAREDEKGYHHLETWRGSYHRAISLPEDIDEDAVTAGYKNGILLVTLPKRPEATLEARTIPVTVS